MKKPFCHVQNLPVNGDAVSDNRDFFRKLKHQSPKITDENADNIPKLTSVYNFMTKSQFGQKMSYAIILFGWQYSIVNLSLNLSYQPYMYKRDTRSLIFEEMLAWRSFLSIALQSIRTQFLDPWPFYIRSLSQIFWLNKTPNQIINTIWP